VTTRIETHSKKKGEKAIKTRIEKKGNCWQRRRNKSKNPLFSRRKKQNPRGDLKAGILSKTKRKKGGGIKRREKRKIPLSYLKRRLGGGGGSCEGLCRTLCSGGSLKEGAITAEGRSEKNFYSGRREGDFPAFRIGREKENRRGRKRKKRHREESFAEHLRPKEGGKKKTFRKRKKKGLFTEERAHRAKEKGNRSEPEPGHPIKKKKYLRLKGKDGFMEDEEGYYDGKPPKFKRRGGGSLPSLGKKRSAG